MSRAGCVITSMLKAQGYRNTLRSKCCWQQQERTATYSVPPHLEEEDKKQGNNRGKAKTQANTTTSTNVGPSHHRSRSNTHPALSRTGPLVSIPSSTAGCPRLCPAPAMIQQLPLRQRQRRARARAQDRRPGRLPPSRTVPPRPKHRTRRQAENVVEHTAQSVFGNGRVLAGTSACNISIGLGHRSGPAREESVGLVRAYMSRVLDKDYYRLVPYRDSSISDGKQKNGTRRIKQSLSAPPPPRPQHHTTPSPRTCPTLRHPLGCWVTPSRSCSTHPRTPPPTPCPPHPRGGALHPPPPPHPRTYHAGPPRRRTRLRWSPPLRRWRSRSHPRTLPASPTRGSRSRRPAWRRTRPCRVRLLVALRTRVHAKLRCCCWETGMELKAKKSVGAASGCCCGCMPIGAVVCWKTLGWRP